VGHAACQPPDGLHFLRLAKLFFEGSAFRNVFGDHLQVRQETRCVRYSAPAQPDGNRFAVFALPLCVNAVEPTLKLALRD
jgi:hypothetical protein